MGLGVRVQKGDATGYAHVEDLSWDAMKRAAETAARIAQGGKTIAPLKIERISLPSRYDLDRPSIDVPVSTSALSSSAPAVLPWLTTRGSSKPRRHSPKRYARS